jgi:hypothetical protein
VTVFIRRIFGAMTLDSRVFEEVETDLGADGQAMAVVLMAAAAAGIGATGFGLPRTSIPSLLVVACLSWAAWAFLTLQVGRQLLPTNDTRADVGQLMRTLGFSAAPGLMLVAGVLDDLTAPIFVVGAIWLMSAMVVAVRQALDYSSTWRALTVCAIGLALSVLIVVLIGSWLGPVLSYDGAGTAADQLNAAD